MDKTKLRLNKFIAQQMGLGRRAADELIQKGKVLVNGQKPELGYRVNGSDKITVNGKRLSSAPADFTYLLMNKPINYVCSRRQQDTTPTIYSLLPKKYQHLKTVGRLDKNSSGLILLTNDGNLAHHLTHPSFAKIKKYEVSLDKPIEPLHRQMINDFGITLPDGPSKLQLQRLKDSDDTNWLVTMIEGRNRQIRRTFAALGYNVTKLHRIQFGRLSLDDLKGQQINEVNKSAIG